MIVVVLVAALLVFVVASALRAYQYARLPVHLRWELYPVPRGRPLGELRVMVPEILFMRGLREFNRVIWRKSYPFHAGLYLLGATVGLVVLAVAGDLVAPAVTTGAWRASLRGLYRLTGFAGLTLALLGAAALLVTRLRDETLRIYTTPGDLFNLGWFIAAFGCLLLGALLRGPDDPGAAAVARAVLTLDTGLRVPGLWGAGLLLAAPLAAYIPFTHMSHFIGKYFTYHAIRWDDRTGGAGSAIARRLAEHLTYRPTWAAPHIGADGAKTWADVVAAPPPEDRA